MKQNIAEQIIYFNEVFDEYGITLTEDNVSFILLKYCPWCGSLLPESKRLIWFEQLEEMGYENPFLRDDIPSKYKCAEWYMQKNE